jgi:hypothetical protein
MNFSSFRPKLKQKFELSQNFELTRFTVLAQKYHCNKPENHHEQSMGLTLLDWSLDPKVPAQSFWQAYIMH